MASIEPDEKNESLRSSIISTISQLQVSPTTIHVDNATGFLSFKNDQLQHQKGIALDFGYIKNPKKNVVIDKGVQELEVKLLKADPAGLPVNDSQLQQAVSILNHRIPNWGY